MHTLTSILSASLILTMLGCTSNAPKGQGGLAEHNAQYSHAPEHPSGLDNALYFEQQLAARHLDALIAAGANICFPASIKSAKIRQSRIARELQGELNADAANDLIVQRDKLARLERRLNYVQMQDSCLPAAHKNSNREDGELANETNATTALSQQQQQYIIALLNNNNQFVFNSAELNPRFIGQLSEATQLLREHPQYHLKLTGHSDIKGKPDANLALSIKRATQVERYLLIFGFSPNNIDVSGSGATAPLFDQDAAEVRLVNRRVSIELIDITRSSEATPK